jgi:hypothetical protein
MNVVFMDAAVNPHQHLPSHNYDNIETLTVEKGNVLVSNCPALMNPRVKVYFPQGKDDKNA